MHPTARRCVQWAVGLVVAGTLLLAYGPGAFGLLAGVAGPTAQTGLHLVTLGLTLVNAVVFPVAAALVGAAVVLQVLTREGVLARGDRAGDRTDDGTGDDAAGAGVSGRDLDDRDDPPAPTTRPASPAR